MLEKIAFISVEITQREGAFFACSPDLPGLNLCGKSLQDVKDDVGPMIERLYSMTRGIKVRAARAVDAQSFDTPANNSENMRFWAKHVEAVAA